MCVCVCHCMRKCFSSWITRISPCYPLISYNLVCETEMTPSALGLLYIGVCLKIGCPNMWWLDMLLAISQFVLWSVNPRMFEHIYPYQPYHSNKPTVLCLRSSNVQPLGRCLVWLCSSPIHSESHPSPARISLLHWAYPLVMTNIANWKITMLWMGKINYFDWAMFNS